MNRSDEITSWLTAQVASFLDIEAADVDENTPLAEYGLDSVYALTLCGEIEDTYGIEVESTLAWDYPTVAALAGFLLEATEAAA
jgi:acyl carrier protein